jgi:hypothetical protein
MERITIAKREVFYEVGTQNKTVDFAGGYTGCRRGDTAVLPGKQRIFGIL